MMKRTLAIILAATILVFLPMAVHALGFGNLTLHSALNEPLDADIELLSPTEDDLANVKIKLASPSAFRRSGIERIALLTELRFEVIALDSGDYVIHLKTRIPVREPFLNFLLELEWQNGRMLREYTMLLDPPGLVKKQPMMVEAPTAAPEAIEPEPMAAPFAEPEPVAVPFVEPEPVAQELPEPETIEPAREELAAVEPEVVQPEQASLPEPIAEPLPEPSAEPLADPVAEEIAMPMGEVIEIDEPATESEVFEDDTALFPSVPLSSYKATASDEGIVEVEEEIEVVDAADSEIDAKEEFVFDAEAGMAEAPAESDPTLVAGGELGDLDYGIVNKGDNLWTIAEKLRQNDDSVTVYQVMMALLRSNPDAFVDANINRLKVGHVLRIEDPTMLVEISAAEAAQEYQSQTAAWEDYRQSVAQTTSEQAIIGSEMVEPEFAAADTGGELTLSSPDATSDELSGGTGVTEDAVNNDIVTLQDELRQVRQDASTMRGRNSELNSKLRELEDELSQMQRSVSVKDDELAALQQQLAGLKSDVAAQSAVMSEPEATTQVAEQPAEVAVMPEEVMPEEVMPEEVMPEETAPVTPVTDMASEQPVESDVAVDAAMEAETQQAEPAVPPPVMTPPVQIATDEGVMDIVMGAFDVIGETLRGLFGSIAGDSLLIFIALPVILVLIIIVFIIVRRRSKSGDSYEESILSGDPASALNSVTNAETEEESSFLSDFAVSGAGAIQTEDSEVDPLTEADVFMAYGRYEAAEERLKEAIEAEPARPELKLKLIELFFSTKNKPAFENAAEDFYASVGDNADEDPAWQKVASMGADLVPANPLFSGTTAAPIAPMEEEESDISSASLTDSQVMDIGLDTGVFSSSDFSLESDADIPAPATEAAQDQTDIDSGVMEFTLDTETESTTTAASTDETEVDTQGPDFNLDIGEDVGLADELTDDSLLDFSLDADSGKAASREDISKTMDFAIETEEVTSDSVGLDFDLDMATDTADESGADLTVDNEGTTSTGMPEPSLDFELNASDAGDLDLGGDEVGTKLDLAKAYIDMGDPDGAKSILDEVMGEGNDTQVSEAKELLQQIG